MLVKNYRQCKVVKRIDSRFIRYLKGRLKARKLEIFTDKIDAEGVDSANFGITEKKLLLLKVIIVRIVLKLAVQSFFNSVSKFGGRSVRKGYDKKFVSGDGMLFIGKYSRYTFNKNCGFTRSCSGRYNNASAFIYGKLLLAGRFKSHTIPLLSVSL